MSIKSRKTGFDRSDYLIASADHLPFGIYILDEDMVVQYVNKQFLSMTDMRMEEIYESLDIFYSSIHSEDKEEFFRVNEAALTNRTEFSHELRLLTKGSIRWFWFRSVPRLGDDNRWYWHGTVLDITQRKETERLQAELAGKFKAFIDISGTGAWEYDVHNDRLWFSDQYLSMLGVDAYSFRQRYGEKLQNWIEYMHPEDRLEAAKVFKHYIEDEMNTGVYETRFRMKHADGRWIWILSRGNKLLNDQGEFTGKIVGTHIDISEHKNQESELKALTLKYNIVSDHSPGWDYWLKPDGNFDFVSPMCELISGYSAQEFMMNPSLMDEIIHPEDLFIWNRHLNASHQNLCETAHSSIDFRIICKDGSTRWISHVCKPVFDSDGQFQGRRGSNHDVTDSIKTSLQMTKLKQAIEHNPVTIVITDLDGVIEYVNPKFTEITGYTFEEAVGQNPRILKSESFKKEDYTKLWNTIKSGRTWTGEFKNKKKNGEFYWEYALIAPIFSENGVITNFVAVKEDITLLKQRESELSEIVTIVSQQNKQLHEFNYILSHNIRSHAANIAAIVQEFREADTIHSFTELTALLGNVSEGLLNTLQNLNENLSIQRDVNIKREYLQLHAFVTETLQINNALIEDFNIDVHVSVPKDYHVHFNKAYLQSVLQNLVSNAIRYRCTSCRPGLWISAERVGSQIHLHVKDNGIGIDLTLHGKRIFNLGQVFHEHPESRGLGLYIVRNQVTAMDSEIHVASQPQQGSTFSIYFNGETPANA